MTIGDVTEQRLAQRASREAQERFRVAFEHAPVGIALAALDGRLESVNLALAQLLRDARRGPAARDARLTPASGGRRARGRRHRELAQDPARVYVAEKRILHADGREIWVSLQVAVIRDGAGRP